MGKNEIKKNEKKVILLFIKKQSFYKTDWEGTTNGAVIVGNQRSVQNYRDTMQSPSANLGGSLLMGLKKSSDSEHSDLNENNSNNNNNHSTTTTANGSSTFGIAPNSPSR